MQQTKKLVSFPEPYKFKLCIGLYLFEEGYSFNLLGLWFKLGFSARAPKDMCDFWGISYTDNAFQWAWGKNPTVIFAPWDVLRSYREVLTCEGTWVPLNEEADPHFSKMLVPGAYKDDRLMHEAPFNYVKKNGEVQKTKAAFYVTRSTWKWRILRRFKKFNLGANTTHEINVKFKNQIGEGVGTWKGGVYTCIHPIIKEDETPFHTFHRMNMQRKFS